MRKIFNTFVTLVLAVALSAPVNAADELLPVTEAFKYVVSDTGEAF